MKVMLVFLGLLMFTTPAFALNDEAVDWCLTTDNIPKCLAEFRALERQADLAASRRAQRQYEQDRQRLYEQQLELARIQADGMALFGAGAASINGMTQGFQNMRVPYVNTPQYQYNNAR